MRLDSHEERVKTLESAERLHTERLTALEHTVQEQHIVQAASRMEEKSSTALALLSGVPWQIKIGLAALAIWWKPEAVLALLKLG